MTISHSAVPWQLLDLSEPSISDKIKVCPILKDNAEVDETRLVFQSVEGRLYGGLHQKSWTALVAALSLLSEGDPVAAWHWKYFFGAHKLSFKDLHWVQ